MTDPIGVAIQRPLVIYHAHCADGAGAAYACWKRFGDAAEYRAANYSDPPPTEEEVRGRTVYIVDFSFKKEDVLRLGFAGAKVVVLDHHKTAQADLESLKEGVDLRDERMTKLAAQGLGLDIDVKFDMERSGAMLAWDYFHGSSGVPVPDALLYVQDRDLWRWKLPHSKEVSAAMYALGVVEDFRKFDELPPLDVLVQMGGALVLQEQRMVKSLCGKATSGVLDGATIPVLNTANLQSEALNELAKGQPFAAAWFIKRDGRTQVSLRADGTESSRDVSKVAQLFGGGGHRNAAGFESDLSWRDIFGR